MSNSEIAKNFKRNNLPESEVELSGEVPFEAVAPYRAQALAHLAEHVEMPGFRPGKVPQEMVLKKVGETAVLEEAVELFVKDFYPELIDEHKVDPVARPEVRITKLAPENPVGISFRVTLYPTFELPRSWKSVGEKIALETPLPATEEEVQQTLDSLQKARAEEGKPLPEINDEFAKSVGAFETLDALKEQIKKGIGEEKVRASKDKRRGQIIEALLKDVQLAVPRIFIESEQEKIIAQMREDVARFGMQFDDYLKRVNKTEEAIRAEFREQAAKRAKLQLVLNKIAEEEKVEADKEAVDAELKHALEHFPQANPVLVRVHIETVMKNEKVLKLLEGEEKTAD